MGNRLLFVALTCLTAIAGCTSKERLETAPDSPLEGFGEYVSGILPYRMKNIAADGTGRPILVMYLHGGSSKGNDNEAQMKEAAVGVISKYLADNSRATASKYHLPFGYGNAVMTSSTLIITASGN